MAEHEDEGGGEDGGAKKKFSGKKLVLFVILPLALLIGAGAGVYFSGLLDGLLGLNQPPPEEEEKPKEDPHAPPVFLDIPDMLVNLNAAGRRPAFLKIKIAIQVAKQEDVPAVEHVMPRIIDSFQVYLRELRLEDLKGSAGMYRLRQELLLRITAAAHPVKVKDVLFKEMLVQ